MSTKVYAARHNHRAHPSVMLLCCLVFMFALNITAGRTISDLDRECSTQSNRFLTGLRYKFKYMAKTESSILGTSDSKSGLRIDCVLSIEAQQHCQMMLKTTQCQLRELSSQNQYKFSRRSNSFSEDMQRYPVVFTMRNGQLNKTSITTHGSEDTTIVNIKRGIVSGLQLYKIQSTHQTVMQQYNVHGTCDVTLRYSSNGNKATVTTVTDLKSCDSSHQFSTSFSPVSLIRSAESSQSQSVLNPMKSSHQCTHHVKRNGEIREANCTEEHMLIPFSNMQGQKSGANTRITQWFKFVSKENARHSPSRNIPENARKIVGVQYEYESARSSDRKNIKVIVAQFLSLASNTGGVKKSHPHQFAGLVSSVRTLESEQIKLLINKVLNEVACQRARCDSIRQRAAVSLLRDLLLSCGSHGCISGLIHLASSSGQAVSPASLQLVLYSIALHYTPNDQVITDLMTFCKKSNPTRTCHLTLAAIVNRYAEQNPSFYINNQENAVFKTIQYLKSSLGSTCKDSAESSKKELKPLVFLQALGNIGWPVQIYDHKMSSDVAVMSTILSCITDQGVPKTASLEAIQALRRMRGDENIRTSLMNIVNSSDNQVQVRISAYAMLIKHVDGATMDQILSYVQHEDLNQMKTFILSNIKNIIESKEPSQQLLRRTVLSAIERSHINLEDISPRGSMDSQSADFVKNIELPIFNQTVAGQLNGNLVYDPSSYIPRSGMLNATVNIFGKSINLFELGLSIKGFEPIVEALFGPNGYMHQDSWLDLLHNLLNNIRAQPINSRVAQSAFSHFKRRIVRELESLHRHISKSMHTSQDGSVYLKLLGHELGFGTLDDLLNLMIHGEDLIHVFSMLRGQSFGTSSKFMETSLVMPTCIGLPLTIATDGVYVLKSHLQARPTNIMSISGSVSFSGAVDFSSDIRVSISGLATTGVEMKTSALMNTEIQGTASIGYGKITFETQNLDSPTDILHLSSTLSLVTSKGKKRIEASPQTATRGGDCTSDLVAKVTGLRFCTDYTYHASKFPYMPLNGPLQTIISVKPAYKDVSTLKYVSQTQKKSGHSSYSRLVSLTVPGVAVRCQFTKNDQPEKAGQLIKCGHGDTLNTATSPLFVYQSQVDIKKDLNGDGSGSNEVSGLATQHRHSDWSLVLPPSALHLHNTHSTKPGKRFTRIFNVTYKCLDTKKGIDITSHFYTKMHVDLEAKMHSASGQKAGHLAEFVVEMPGQNVQAIFVGQKSNATYDADVELSWTHSHLHRMPRHRRSVLSVLNRMEETVSGGLQKMKDRLKTVLANSWHHRKQAVSAHNRITKDGYMNDASDTHISRVHKAANLKLKITQSFDEPTRWWQNVGSGRYAYDLDLTYPWGNERPTIHAEGTLINRSHSSINQRWHVNSDITHSEWPLTLTGKMDVERNKNLELKHIWRVVSSAGQSVAVFNSSVTVEPKPRKIVYSHALFSATTRNNASAFFYQSSNGRTISLTLNGKGRSSDHPLLNYDTKNKIGIDSKVWNSEGFWNLPSLKSQSSYTTFWSNEKTETSVKVKNTDTQKPKFNLDYKWHKTIGSSLSLTQASSYNVHARLDYTPVKRLNVTFASMPSKQNTLSTYITMSSPRHLNITVYQTDKTLSNVPVQSMQSIFSLNDNKTLSANIVLSPNFKEQINTFAKRKWNQMKENLENFKTDQVTFITEMYHWTMKAYCCTLNHIQHTMKSISNSALGWFVRYYELGDHILNKLSPTLQSALRGDVVQQMALAIRKNLLSSNGNSIYFNTITQPFALDDFLSLPRLSGAYNSWLSNIKHLWHRITTGYLYHGKHTAMVYGSGHIVTFDGRFFEIPSFPHKDCTYVMAGDFVERNFTILKNKKELTVLTREVAVTFTHDGKVMLNNSNKYSELPMQSWDGNVKVRRHNNNIELTTTYGLLVSCDTTKQQCAIEISGWYHNRTLGLLGTNDHEPSNDFRKRDGRLTSSVYDFINSYEVSGMRSCRVSSGMTRITRESGCLSPASSQCQKIFSSQSSPLSPCFNSVDPTPYKEACTLDTSKCEAESVEKKKVCESASAYVKMCSLRGIHVQLNSQCRSCEGHNIDEVWNQRIGHKVDVVMVTSLHRAMGSHQSPSVYLRPLVHGIQQKLRGAGNVRYGLVGFAGRGVHSKEHIRTLNGELFESHLHLQRQVRLLNPEGDTSLSSTEALRLAANYPFRSGASHVILLVTDNDKQNEHVDHSLMSELAERGITVNSISRYDELSSNNILGMNWKEKPVVDNRSPRNPAAVNIYPQGENAQISKVTKGCVFNLDLLMRSNRQLIHSVARQIHLQVMKDRKKCRQCSCLWSPSNQGIQRCHWTDC